MIFLSIKTNEKFVLEKYERIWNLKIDFAF